MNAGYLQVLASLCLMWQLSEVSGPLFPLTRKERGNKRRIIHPPVILRPGNYGKGDEDEEKLEVFVEEERKVASIM